MKIKYTLLLANLLLLAVANGAVTISVIANSGSGLYQDSLGGSLADGSLLRYGFFDETSFDGLSSSAQQDYTQVNALFTEVGTASASSGAILSLNNSFTGLSAGDKLYTWVFNTADAASATEWGVFSSSNTLWDVPADLGTATLSTSTVDNVVIGGISGANFTLTAVPEPSTYAMLSGLCVLGFAALRRRRA